MLLLLLFFFYKPPTYCKLNRCGVMGNLKVGEISVFALSIREHLTFIHHYYIHFFLCLYKSYWDGCPLDRLVCHFPREILLVNRKPIHCSQIQNNEWSCHYLYFKNYSCTKVEKTTLKSTVVFWHVSLEFTHHLTWGV